jgi:hypothetical protein
MDHLQERHALSVIARKIAIAADTPTDRSEPAEVALSFASALKSTLESWLSVNDVGLDLVRSAWSLPNADDLQGHMIGCRGPSRSDRAALCVDKALAEHAVLSLLRLGPDLSAERLRALHPFAVQNLMVLGERLNDSGLFRDMDADRPVWTSLTSEELQAEMAKQELISSTWRITGLCDTDVSLTLLITQDMRRKAAEAANDALPERPHLPPRLGPCHVEVRAVGDRVRLSVADCTRLEIGQTIPLKGLRFDKLELDVDMGDGRVPLTDAALGADKGHKAVRLNRGLDPAFREAPASAQPSKGAGTGPRPVAT